MLRELCNAIWWGMMIELGVKPLEYEVHHKRLMLYHNIINSNHERITRQIIQQQQAGACPEGDYLEIEKPKKKKKVISLNFKLFHLYFATFLVQNIIFSSFFWAPSSGNVKN